jgi:hypothetical protein
MIHQTQNISPFVGMHIVRNKISKTIHNKVIPTLKLSFFYICLTLLTFLVEKRMYEAIHALDLSQITRILADGNQFGFAQYAFNAIVRPKL